MYLAPADVSIPDNTSPMIGNFHKAQMIGGLMMKNWKSFAEQFDVKICVT